MKTTNKHNELISLGSLLNRDKEFSKIYSSIADPFRATLDRRNKVPGSHPYSTKGGSRNSYLRPQEQKKLQQELSFAYRAIIENMQIYNIFYY